MESPKIGVAVRREAVHPVRDPYVALSLQKEGSRGVPEGQNIWSSPGGRSFIGGS